MTVSEAMILVAIAATQLAAAKILWSHHRTSARVVGRVTGVITLLWGFITLLSFLRYGITGVDQWDPPSPFLTASFILSLSLFYIAVIFRAGKSNGGA